MKFLEIFGLNWKGLGHTWNYVSCERVFLEIKQRTGFFFEKKGYKDKGPLIEWEERGGLNAKWPFIPFLPPQDRGGAPAHRRRPSRPLQAPGVAVDRGKRERGVRGTDPRPHLELGWRAEAGRGEQAAACGDGCGGGAAG